jgi:hypothetical protein
MGGVLAWLDALPLPTQIFFGLFLVFIALPIATLTVLQFIESVRSLRSGSAKDPDKDR